MTDFILQIIGTDTYIKTVERDSGNNIIGYSVTATATVAHYDEAEEIIDLSEEIIDFVGTRPIRR